MGAEKMLVPGKDIIFKPNVYEENQVINIVPDLCYQEVFGFGATFTESSCFNYAKLSPKNQETVLEALFDTEKGLGLNFCRTTINSCDFATERYIYVTDDDPSLKTFSIERDLETIIPLIKAAKKRSKDLLLFASPWSPPAWMKDNKKVINGGRLLDEYYQTWADYFAKYFEAYKKAGIDFFGCSVQNEAAAWQTWESCKYTAEEEGIFVTKHLRPTLDKSGFKHLSILVWDHNRERLLERAIGTFAVPGAKDDIWGLAYHWYSGDHFFALDMTKKMFPDKPLILSEFCYSEFDITDEAPSVHSGWKEAENYLEEYIDNFNHHMSAFCGWIMIGDLKGGPYHDRVVGCKAPIVADFDNDKITIEPIYYATAHFSRFVKRGATKIGVSYFSKDIKATAFQNPDGELILIVLNKTDKETDIFFRLKEKTAEVTLAARSLSTYVI